MKRRGKKTKRQVHDFPVWTHEQATAALPYVESVLKSIRELFLGYQSNSLRAKRLDDKPGRPDRDLIIERDDARREAGKLQDELIEAVEELARLNVQCVDPAAGIAMIPFVNAEQLSWFVFDLFEPAKIASWRYHHDPLQTRRPMSQMHDPAKALPVIV